jgi:hypothetical protein
VRGMHPAPDSIDSRSKKSAAATLVDETGSGGRGGPGDDGADPSGTGAKNSDVAESFGERRRMCFLAASSLCRAMKQQPLAEAVAEETKTMTGS